MEKLLRKFDEISLPRGLRIFDVVSNIRSKYENMGIEYRKTCIRVTKTVDGKKYKKCYYYEEFASKMLAETVAINDRNNNHWKSVRSNTGYNHITLVKTDNGKLKLKGYIHYKGVLFSKQKTIYSYEDYAMELRNIINYIGELIGIQFTDDVDVSLGYKTIKESGIKMTRYIYTIIDEDSKVVETYIAYHADEVREMTHLTKRFFVRRIGVANNDMLHGKF